MENSVLAEMCVAWTGFSGGWEANLFTLIVLNLSLELAPPATPGFLTTHHQKNDPWSSNQVVPVRAKPGKKRIKAKKANETLALELKTY